MQSNVNLKRVLEVRVHAYISSQTGLDFYDSEIKKNISIIIIINRCYNQDQRKQFLIVFVMITITSQMRKFEYLKHLTNNYISE